MPDALAMVKVGNNECGLVKLTPLSRTAARAGAVSGVIESARRPSGTKRIRLRRVCASAGASCRKAATHAAESKAFGWNDMQVLPISFSGRGRYACYKTVM